MNDQFFGQSEFTISEKNITGILKSVFKISPLPLYNVANP